ncbi:hypothetical protein AAZX31_01G032900 [Glycine max]|uniref:C2H2-type domain-containing protein n=1 Tax=Glycine max TaxID=3847 RepID=K7K1K3_SOYBN|nr:hypothetical protein GYH30_000354 [Glycine max]KRH74654.1 hypothetical protein GLYMA_01G034500v4 [Glycine max]
MLPRIPPLHLHHERPLTSEKDETQIIELAWFLMSSSLTQCIHVCEVCKRVFENKSALNGHSAIHKWAIDFELMVYKCAERGKVYDQ